MSAQRAFLVSDFGPEAASVRGRVRGGEVAIAKMPASRRRGEAVAVQDGLISHWRGSIFLPGVELEPLLQRLQHPNERGPHQPDVLAVRVLERQPDHLRLYIRMTRSSVVTVTYDTEHLLDYRRHGQTRASSRSVSTRISELDDAGADTGRAKREGQDRGFLWRLNSYWRFEETGGGVIVECESISLSRSIPFGFGWLVGPFVESVPQESLNDLLVSIRDGAGKNRGQTGREFEGFQLPTS